MVSSTAPVAIDIDTLSVDELIALNRRIVERLRLIQSAEHLTRLAQFSIGDVVEFTTDDGRLIRATVVRLNSKTATVVTTSGNWRVSPSLLRKAHPQASVADPLAANREPRSANILSMPQRRAQAKVRPE